MLFGAGAAMGPGGLAENIHTTQVLVITNNAMNIVEHMSLLHGCGSFGYMPKSGIAGSCGRLIPIFLKNRHTDLQNWCTSLHSH